MKWFKKLQQLICALQGHGGVTMVGRDFGRCKRCGAYFEL